VVVVVAAAFMMIMIIIIGAIGMLVVGFGFGVVRPFCASGTQRKRPPTLSRARG